MQKAVLLNTIKILNFEQMKRVFFTLTLLIGLFACSQQGVGDELDSVDVPTFAQHIAPIIVNHCVRCHRNGGGAPFELTSYSKVKGKAKTIAKVTSMRIMPPWPADPNYSHFIDENILTQSQIDAISRWVKNDCIEGGSSEKIFANVSSEKSNIGKPDMVLSLDTVLLSEGDVDRFFFSKVNCTIPHGKYIRAIEFIPGQPKLLHHFNGHLINYYGNSKPNLESSPSKIEISPKPGVDNPRETKLAVDFQKSLLNNDGSMPERWHSVVNYLPGVKGLMYPDGIGTYAVAEKFSIIGNDVHYGPSRKTLIDNSKINIFFTNTPPKRGTGEIMLGTNGVSKIVPPLVIPANQKTKHVTHFTVAEDISVLTINPHLHLLGKSFLAYAIKPNGDTVKLINIPKWNFRWQYFYTFKKMVYIPRGSTIYAVAEFDNTLNNPNNPNHPPKQVAERLEYGGSSMRATDEMFQFIITYVGYQSGDEKLSLENGNR